ncbi:hypothetical protein KA977_13585 [Candidatus Dependentiae bacterium]|nr:hypothetical protein [Candidatus Dependentiae bacterium]
MENKIKKILILNAAVWIFNLIMYLANIQSKDPEIMENMISYQLLFLQIGISFTVFSIAILLWEDIVMFFKAVFMPSFSIFYSIITSILLLLYLLSGMLSFAEGKGGMELLANIFICVLIIQPAVFFFTDKSGKGQLVKGVSLMLIGFIGLIIFLIGGQKIPGVLIIPTENGIIGGTGNIQGKDIMFLSLTAFLVIIAGTLETQKYVEKIKNKF